MWKSVYEIVGYEFYCYGWYYLLLDDVDVLYDDVVDVCVWFLVVFLLSNSG